MYLLGVDNRHAGAIASCPAAHAGPIIAVIAVAAAFSVAADEPSATESASSGKPEPVAARQFLGLASSTKRGIQRNETPFFGRLSSFHSAQIAFVIDGTQSMKECRKSMETTFSSWPATLANYLQQGEDQKNADPKVTIAAVVYGDVGRYNNRKPVTLITPRFAPSSEDLDEAVRGVEKTGEPGVEQRVDAGVFEALTKLDWNADAGCRRLLIIFGNSPPHDEGNEYREHTADELVQLARQRRVTILGMLAESDEDVESDQRMKSFLLDLCMRTGGHLADLQSQSRWAYWAGIQGRIVAITPAELAEHQRQAGSMHRAADLMTISLGDQQGFRSENLCRTVMRVVEGALRGIDGVSIRLSQSRPAEVAPPASDESKPEQDGEGFQLNSALKYICGEQYLELQMAKDKEVLARTSCRLSQPNIAAQCRQVLVCLETLFDEVARHFSQRQEAGWAGRFEAAADRVRFPSRELRLSTNAKAQQHLEEAIVPLENSLAATGTDEGELLDKARELVAKALDLDPGNPFGHLLLAHYHFNRWHLDAVPSSLDQYQTHLKLAYRSRDRRALNDPVRIEIEAEYALMGDRDVPLALERYRELTDRTSDDHGGHTLRAHWMLAGIHMGDWEVASIAPEYVNPDKARRHILEILAFWPHSAEATYYLQQDILAADNPP